MCYYFFIILFVSCYHLHNFTLEHVPRTYFVTVREKARSRVGIFTSDQEKSLYIAAIQDALFSPQQASIALTVSSVFSALAGFAAHNLMNNVDYCSDYTAKLLGAGIVLASMPLMFHVLKKQTTKYNRKNVPLDVQYVGESCKILNSYDGSDMLEIDTSFNVTWPPPQGYEEKLDEQRFHAALISKTIARSLFLTPPDDFHCNWWIELPNSLQKRITRRSLTSDWCTLNDYFGRPWISCSHAYLDMDQLPSLKACVDKEYKKTTDWIRAIVERDLSPADILPPPNIIEQRGTLGYALWNQSQANEQNSSQMLPHGLQQLYRSCNVRNVVCFRIQKENGSCYALTSKCFLPSMCPSSIRPISSKVISLDLSHVFAGQRDITSVEDYAASLSVDLAFPPPEQYKNKLEEQQYDSALYAFLIAKQCASCSSSWNKQDIALLDEDAKIIRSSTDKWVIIKNTVIPFKGVFDWDAIQKRFPKFYDALEGTQDPINKKIKLNEVYVIDFHPDSLGFYLLGEVGTAMVNDYFEPIIKRPIPKLYAHIYDKNFMLVALLESNGSRKHVIATSAPEFILKSLAVGAHMHTMTDCDITSQCGEVVKKIKEDSCNSEIEADVPMNGLQCFDLQEINKESVTLSLEKNTFAEATGTFLKSRMPKCYNNQQEKYRMHSALRLFLTHHKEEDSDESSDDDAESVMHVPDSFAANISIQHNKKRAYAYRGNMRFRYLIFDWGRVQERYPTREASIAIAKNLECLQEEQDFTKSVIGKNDPEVECFNSREKILREVFDENSRLPKVCTNMVLEYLYGFLFNGQTR